LFWSKNAKKEKGGYAGEIFTLAGVQVPRHKPFMLVIF
jgi:hypothetical protein